MLKKLCLMMKKHDTYKMLNHTVQLGMLCACFLYYRPYIRNSNASWSVFTAPASSYSLTLVLLIYMILTADSYAQFHFSYSIALSCPIDWKSASEGTDEVMASEDNEATPLLQNNQNTQEQLR